MNKKVYTVLNMLSIGGCILAIVYMFVKFKVFIDYKMRYHTISTEIGLFMGFMWIPYFLYTWILLNEIRLNEICPKRRNIRKRHIYISSVATVILIVTMLFLPYDKLKDLWNIKNNNYIYIEDTIKDIQVEEKRRVSKSNYNYMNWIIETESNGVIIYEEITEQEHEIFKQIKPGDRVEMAFLPITKIPAEISKIEEE